MTQGHGSDSCDTLFTSLSAMSDASIGAGLAVATQGRDYMLLLASVIGWLVLYATDNSSALSSIIGFLFCAFWPIKNLIKSHEVVPENRTGG